ncbi:uncharacterized protein LOC113272672 [Papaver somniferum]|uniref:uncharacterized protein LOC113272672 n=1 Tax=Papaver somniferum TaxID=3469 RepID=UPI000E705DA1|nr:uncharacterized protein LOC113272672 [Papaver somniferum]
MDLLKAIPIAGLNQAVGARQFSVVLQYRLGIPLFEAGSSCSICARPWIYGDHAIHCVREVGPKFRHDMVRDAFADMCYKAGVAARKEVSLGFLSNSTNTQKPADILVYYWIDGKDVCFDVTWVFPFTSARTRSFTPDHAILAVVTRKMHKYLDQCASHGHGFQVLAFTTLGELSEDTVVFLKRLRNCLVRCAFCAPKWGKIPSSPNAHENVDQNIKCLVGNGANTSLFFDNWCSDLSMAELAGIHNSSRNLSCSRVCDTIVGREWVIPDAVQAITGICGYKSLPKSVGGHNTRAWIVDQDDEIYYVWNVGIAEILMRISEAVDPLAILGGRFLLFIENALSAQICCSTRSSGSIWENNTVLLLPFIPRLVSRVQSDWKFRLLQAFTNTFKGCKPNSALNVACVNAIEELLLPSNRDTSALFADTSESEILDFQISWIQELPHLLVQLGDGHPSSSKVILLFLLRLGQCAPINPSLASGYDNLQKSLTEFYSTPQAEENSECATNNKKSASHYQTVKAVTDVVCSCLSHIGDDATILQMLQRIMVSELSLNPLLDNKRAMLRLLVLLDSKPTILPEQSISNLANSLLQYLLDAASYIPEDNDDIDYDESNDKDQMRICQYYFVPCFFLFDRSGRLLSLVLNLMGSLIAEAKPLDPSHQCNEPVFDRANRISAITSILIFMRGDVKLRRALSSCKAEMTYVLQNLLSLQSSNELNMNLEERHRLQLSYDQLKSFTNT